MLHRSFLAAAALFVCIGAANAQSLSDLNAAAQAVDQPVPSHSTDPNNMAFQGSVPMTVGTTYLPRRSIRCNCTTAGNVSMTLADGSIEVYPVAAPGYFTLPFAVAAVNTSGTTATCTYANLK